ncbi:hypothetical protein [Nocardia brasiliensis]|uniref:hypothetical protein n=1 Tax=Nocardia brasiliensis TaxID=37326 RepID=UPI0024586D23|nr:hypothetical protein [Nocardia brasiliensis]
MTTDAAVALVHARPAATVSPRAGWLVAGVAAAATAATQVTVPLGKEFDIPVARKSGRTRAAFARAALVGAPTSTVATRAEFSEDRERARQIAIAVSASTDAPVKSVGSRHAEWVVVMPHLPGLGAGRVPR